MSLQTVINGRQTPGIAGEYSDTSVKTDRQFIVFGTDGTAATKNPVFGKFFRLTTAALSTGSSETTPVAIQGAVASTAAVLGVLVNPKEHYTNGFVTSMEMDTKASGTISLRGHIWVMSAAAGTVGGKVYIDADGNVVAEDADGAREVTGATYLRDCSAGKLAEIAIDNPSVAA